MDDLKPGTDLMPPESHPAHNAAPHQHQTTLSIEPAHWLFEGPDGLRAGWRIFVYLGMGAVIFFLLSAFVSVIPDRASGIWRDMFMEAVMAISALLPGFVMARIENRPFGVYGLPGRNAFGKQFWLGAVWGIASFSFLMLLLRGIGVFTFGRLALHGERALKFAVFWAVYFLLVGFFEEFAVRGYMQFTLGNSIGFWPSALLLSLLFGAITASIPVRSGWANWAPGDRIILLPHPTAHRKPVVRRGHARLLGLGRKLSVFRSRQRRHGTGHLLNSSFHGSRWLTGGSVGPEGSVLVFVVIALLWVVFDRVYKTRPT